MNARHELSNRRWWRATAVLLFFASLIAALVSSFLHSSAEIRTVAERLTTLQDNLHSIAPIELGDFKSTLPILNAARDLRRTATSEAPVIGWTMGMSQAGRVEHAAQQTYHRLLQQALWPALAERAEGLLRRNDAEAAQLQYETLKAYLMIFDSGHFDTSFLANFFEAVTEVPQMGTAAADFGGHLATLLADSPPKMLTKNDALVVGVRKRLSAYSLPERVFRRLKLQNLGPGIAPFSIPAVVGPVASLIFTRQSGKPLDEGVPSLFTRDGYQRAVRYEIGPITRQMIAEEPWVLGIKAPDNRSEVRVQEDVRRIYLGEYARVWKAYMGDLRLVPTRDLPTLVDLAAKLAAPDVLPPLLRSIARETTLADASQAASPASTPTRPLDQMLGTAGGPASNVVENIVDDQFVGVRRVLSAPAGQGASPLDDTVALVAAFHSWVSAVQQGSDTQSLPAAATPKVKAAAARLPDPLSAILDDLAAKGQRLAPPPLEALKR